MTNHYSIEITEISNRHNKRKTVAYGYTNTEGFYVQRSTKDYTFINREYEKVKKKIMSYKLPLVFKQWYNEQGILVTQKIYNVYFSV